MQACSARSELAQGHWADEQALASLRRPHLADVCFQPCTGLQALAAAGSAEPLRLGVHESESQHQGASYCPPVESRVSLVLVVWVV